MAYLDLQEMHELVGRGKLIADQKRSRVSFLENDHLFDPTISLEEELRTIVHEKTGKSLDGPIRVLTQLRYFGYYFSPINLFYLFDSSDVRIEIVVAEVNNTPWGERHCYVLWEGNQSAAGGLRFQHRKDFHVSPFMPMELDYRWRLTRPADSLDLSLTNSDTSGTLFAASMRLRRREINRVQLARMAVRYPFMTAQISAAIYIQALKLWWKKCPFYTHPKKSIAQASPTTPKLQER